MGWLPRLLILWAVLLVLLMVFLRYSRILVRCDFCGGRIRWKDEVAVDPCGEGKAHRDCWVQYLYDGRRSG